MHIIYIINTCIFLLPILPLISIGGEKRSALTPGVYKTIFQVKDYFEGLGQPTFYPQIDIIFRVSDTTMHHHIPLLLSPYAYSTYRGS